MSGHNRATHKVGVAADAAIKYFTQRLGGGLAGQIDLQGAVDGRHMVIPGDNQRVIGVINGPELDGRIVVQIGVGFLLAHTEGGNCPAPVERFFRVVNHPLFK